MTKMFANEMFSAVLAQAQAGAAPGSGPGPGGMQIIFIVLMFGAMYFLMIAPQRKKQKEHDKMLASLSSGDEIITTGGVYGEITNVKPDRFVIRVGDNTKMEGGKSFIHTVVKKSGEEKQ
jgi:preprotein translocase subunit YajC